MHKDHLSLALVIAKLFIAFARTILTVYTALALIFRVAATGTRILLCVHSAPSVLWKNDLPPFGLIMSQMISP